MGRFSTRSCMLIFASLGIMTFAQSVQAKETQSVEPKTEVETEQKPVLLTADELIDDSENERYIARGNVEAHFEERILTADTLYYYPNSKRIHAIGSVVVVDSNGTVEFADEMELSDDLSAAVALAFFARLKNKATIGATQATHSKDGARNTLTKAFYTSCKACAAKDGEASHKPTWRIRARKVVQNQNTKMINYRDAVLEVKGIPVFYSPVFSHPDPESGRHSGLLFPQIRQSGKYGFSYEQPYYQVLGPYADVMFTPRVFTKQNPILLSEYRQNFHAGTVRVYGSITYERNFDGRGVNFGNREIRGHIFAGGKFALSDQWEWGFGAAAVTDDLFLRRYDLQGENDTRGIYQSNSLRLNNQIYVQGQSEQFFAQGGVIRFQGLRAGDVDDQFPVVGPLFDMRHRIDDPLLGGKVMLRANTVSLTRIDGLDSRRASLNLDWSRRLVSKSGMILRPFAQGRTDLYQIHNPDFFADLGSNNRSVARALGVVGADFRWPFFRPGRKVSWTVEPLVQLAASPNGNGAGNYSSFSTDANGNVVSTRKPIIPNEDSIAVEFDGASLFSSNRFSGFDRWEGGLRANVGGRIAGRWGENGEISLLAGQVFRSKVNTDFTLASGLSGQTSDYVSTLFFSPGPTLNIRTHARFDKNDFSVKRIETDLAVNLNKEQLGPVGRILESFSATVGYLNFDDAIASGRPTEEIRGQATIGLTKHWSILGGATRNLATKRATGINLGIIYHDNCSSLEITYRNNNTTDRTLTPNASIGIRFTLVTLGSFGSR
jgi:LPS-assembly protein